MNQLSCNCDSAECGLTLEVVNGHGEGRPVVAIRINGVITSHEMPTVWLDRAAVVNLCGILRAKAVEMSKSEAE